MKKQIRLLGIDDGPFTFGQQTSIVIGVVMRGGAYLECILCNTITIDGTDATEICLDMIQHSRYKKQLKAILLDGATLGGFNVIDINTIYEKTQIPIITLTRDKPNFTKIEDVLKKHFVDWKDRLTLIKKGTLHKILTKHNPVYIKINGLSISEAEDIIKLSTIRGVIPEPLRIAHLIASGITQGESYGKA
ncbi:MAG: DUF99 family protein [Candidatus Thermoplasmatota archaeon]|nr:DUF99 family protein [Candidatus Thermoplasmatota archaeon]MBU1940498.1 DUF99 family protein [Candidatus Thermoplasmatota archaeon]